MTEVRTIDSHTEGEPTRVVVEGIPDLGSGGAAERARRFREDHDGFRSAVCNEPRGFDAMVGALLLPPDDPGAVAQVIFFNNVSTLHMCVHGTIGVAETLRHMGRVETGSHRLETPVGEVTFDLRPDGSVAVANVESYRHARDIAVDVGGHGRVVGDVAWGGNWFFLVEGHGLDLSITNLAALTDYAWDTRQALSAAGITGADGGEIDHVELFGPPSRPENHSRNFVLCPGREYDRSPCGTGTSAKLACLYADGKLAVGDTWRQESILGTSFSGEVVPTERGVMPTVSGRAWITGENRLVFADGDPFREGIVK